MRTFTIEVSGQSFNFNEPHWSKIDIEAETEEEALARAKKVSSNWTVQNQDHKVLSIKEFEHKTSELKPCWNCGSIRGILLPLSHFGKAYCLNCGENENRSEEGS